MERIRRDKLGLDKADKDDPDRGYIVRYDNNNIDHGDFTFPLAASGLEMVLEYPDGDDATAPHIAFIQGYAIPLTWCPL